MIRAEVEVEVMVQLVRRQCFLGWMGIYTLNMLLDYCGTKLSETHTLS